jgi:basic amino acid/polyamine antiporter, APA family
MSKLFVKKSIRGICEETDKKNTLSRALTKFDLVMMGIGTTIGAGIFVLTGQVAANDAGPAVMLSFVCAAIICILAAVCYAEFASLVPTAGGPYSYAYATLGEFVAWTIGWVLTLEFLLAACTVSVAWSGYFSSLLADFGISLPSEFSTPPLLYDVAKGWVKTGAFLNVPAVLIMAMIGVLAAVGIKAAARVNDFLVYIKFGVIILFIIVGFFFIQKSNWSPFIPENTGKFGQFGFSGILRGAGIIFFAFIGFDTLSTLGQEARNPQKDLPIGMIGSLSIATITYVIVALVLTGIVSYKLLGGEAPFAAAVNALGPKFFWMRYVTKCAILAGLTSVILVNFISQTRIFYAMACDGLLPKVFSISHKKFHTPFYNALIFALIAMGINAFFPVDVLGALVSMGALLAFCIVCLGVLILRYTQPHLVRHFKVPFAPWIPGLGCLLCFLQTLALPWIIWVQTIAWILIGLLIYFGYGIRHSKAQEQ